MKTVWYTIFGLLFFAITISAWIVPCRSDPALLATTNFLNEHQKAIWKVTKNLWVIFLVASLTYNLFWVIGTEMFVNMFRAFRPALSFHTMFLNFMFVYFVLAVATQLQKYVRKPVIKDRSLIDHSVWTLLFSKVKFFGQKTGTLLFPSEVYKPLKVILGLVLLPYLTFLAFQEEQWFREGSVIGFQIEGLGIDWKFSGFGSPITTWQQAVARSVIFGLAHSLIMGVPFWGCISLMVSSLWMSHWYLDGMVMSGSVISGDIASTSHHIGHNIWAWILIMAVIIFKSEKIEPKEPTPP